MNKDQEIKQLRDLLKLAVDVIDDFLPNIGHCVLQDYGRLNTVLIEARKACNQ
jgi:hypothetical protein